MKIITLNLIKNLNYIEFKNYYTEVPINISYLFAYFQGLENLEFTVNNDIGVTNMTNIFSNCIKPNNLNVN